MLSDTIDSFVFKGDTQGPTLLVMGGIHGNEKCGPIALSRLVDELNTGARKIKAGTFVTAPICNPEAYRRHTRQCDANLNRIIRHHAEPVLYEHALANQVIALIDNADIVLDLHSYASGTRPFLFLDNDTQDHRAFAMSLNIPYWITGWAEVYAELGNSDVNDGDTMFYSASQGKTALLVECGAHEDPVSADVAYHSVLRALVHFGMIDDEEAISPATPQINHMYAIYLKEKPGHFTRDWQHLDKVSKGDILATYDDGSTVQAPADSVVILPKKSAEPGGEWFYLGQQA